MAASRYRKFLRLCQDWPVDKTKGTRCLGSHIRNQVAIAFKEGEASQVDPEKCDATYRSLSNILSNVHKKDHPVHHVSGATGLSAADCRSVVSDESIDYLSEHGLGGGMMDRIKMRFTKNS